MDPNRVIGWKGDLPWRIPGDLRAFKRLTMGNAVLMGRKTWESIGRPLPGRMNIVLSRQDRPAELDRLVVWINAVEELAKVELPATVFVIGGAAVYRELLPRCGELYVSHVAGEHEGDTWFPPFEEDFHLPGEVVEEGDGFTLKRYARAPVSSPSA